MSLEVLEPAEGHAAKATLILHSRMPFTLWMAFAGCDRDGRSRGGAARVFSGVGGSQDIGTIFAQSHRLWIRVPVKASETLEPAAEATRPDRVDAGKASAPASEAEHAEQAELATPQTETTAVPAEEALAWGPVLSF